MFKSANNSLSDYFRPSEGAEQATGREATGGSASGVGWGAAVGVSDLITAYLHQHGPTTSDRLVADLGLTVSQVLDALSSLERFGFVKVETDPGGRPIVALPS